MRDLGLVDFCRERSTIDPRRFCGNKTIVILMAS